MLKHGRTAILEYQPGQFADLAETPFAKGLWVLLTEPATLNCILETAAVGLPPLVQLEELLAPRFAVLPEGADPERCKTLCLNMVKQLLEAHGYEHTACAFMPPGALFRTAGLYRKKVD